MAVATVTALVCLVTLTTSGAAGAATGVVANAAPGRGCELGNGIKRVVDIQFDNVHYTRDDPNVPSDLEQMPNLLDFLKDKGTLLTDDHNVLVHTSTNFTSNQTGLYEDHTGITQSNSGYYRDSTGTPHSMSSFGYWTSPVSATPGPTSDSNYLMAYPGRRGTVTNDPAPWVPFTRAGCDVGDVGMINQVLENTGPDVTSVFGADSPQAAEAKANPTKAAADFEGLAIHCARRSSLCAAGRPDVLPEEPGGYVGYQALYGNASIQPAVHPSGPTTDLDGNVINDGHGNDGFPGFNLTPATALAYANDMLMGGVQDVNVYVADAHSDNSAANLGDLGPGEQRYETQLQQYNTALGQFFTRLAAEGISPANTLFVVTTDEGDHFAGSAPTPRNCTGAPGNYCTYSLKSEATVNLAGLLATQYADKPAYAIHPDPAPGLWFEGNPPPSDPKLRQTERNIGALTFTNPLTGGSDKVAYYLADPAEEKILHFISADKARTATLTAFSGEDDFITSGPDDCTKPCVYTSPGFAWNHGSLWPDMRDIWVGFVGPGIKHDRVDATTWVDQTDTRPTVLTLTGLRDDYPDEGRVLTEHIKPWALPRALRVSGSAVAALGNAYKQIEAANGRFAFDTLTASTKGIESGSATDDSVYTATEAALARLAEQRDVLASRIDHALLGAEFYSRRIDPVVARELLLQATMLLARAHALAEATGRT